jgi:hypothetical protein
MKINTRMTAVALAVLATTHMVSAATQTMASATMMDLVQAAMGVTR